MIVPSKEMVESSESKMAQELTTSEVAKQIGVSADTLRKWKYRGLLKLAPQGVAGQGRSVECLWSQEAIQEANAWANKGRPLGVNHRYDPALKRG